MALQTQRNNLDRVSEKLIRIKWEAVTVRKTLEETRGLLKGTHGDLNKRQQAGGTGD